MTFDPLTFDGRLSIAAVLVSAASLICWGVMLRRSKNFRGAIESLAPVGLRTPAFWTPLDAVVVMLASLFCIPVIYGLLLAFGIIQNPAPSFEFSLGADPLATVICIVIAQWLMIVLVTKLLSRRGPAWTSIGWSFRRGDLSLGLLWSLLLIPPTLAVNFLVSMMVPYQHNVLDTLKIETSGIAIALVFFSTAVMTPIAEELMFRGLLQSALTRIASVLQVRREFADKKTSEQSEQAIENWKLLQSTDANVPAWPIYASSGTFALMHFGQGAAPIPLFIFALGLGWLYHRTGRLWPSIIVHVMLNAMAIAITIATPAA